MVSARPTLQDVAAVDLKTRARVVRRLCAEVDDVDMRWELVASAFLVPPPRCTPAAAEEPPEQLQFDLEATR
jgi:hypothetical protein